MTIGKQKCSAFITLILLTFNGSVQAHEFWLDPVSANDKQDVKLKVDIRVGQNFVGEAYYYIPGDIKKAHVTDAKGSYTLKRNAGDIPVFDQDVRVPGLQIVSYATTPGQLTYNTAKKFKSFLKTEGIEWVLAEHKTRGLPETGFSEKFVRYAKSLLVRGTATGVDKKLGLQFELVALKSPYQIEIQATENKLPVQLFWRDKPFENGLMSIFEKTGEQVTKTQIRTGKNGIVYVPVKLGKKYMLNVVHMTALEEKSGAVWKSHWASLTFSTKARK